MKPLHVAFVGHMHQPYYKDDLTSSFLLPWVRLRCAKDYYKMPALLDDYPAIKQTFNLVPSLVDQVQNYADGGSQDVYLDLARRPVSTLTGDQRAFIVRWMTESSQIRRVRQYPRYLELERKREQAWSRPAPGAADAAETVKTSAGHRRTRAHDKARRHPPLRRPAARDVAAGRRRLRQCRAAGSRSRGRVDAER